MPHSVTLTWPVATDNVGISRYAVTRNGSWLADVTSAGWRNDSVPPGTHLYTVQALDGAGNTSSVLSTSVFVPDITPPSAPTNVRATLGSPDSATVAWNAATDDAGVHHYVVTSNGVQVAQPGSAAPINVPVVQGQTYRFEVRAIDAAGNVSQIGAAPALVVPDVTAPSSVTQLAARSTGSTSVGLTWAAATDNVRVVSYAITRDGVSVATVNATTLAYTDAGLLSDATYDYGVVAVDGAGNRGGASNVSITLHSADTFAPSAPTNLRGEALGLRRVELSWNASTDDRPGTLRYKVFRDGVRITTVKTTTFIDRPDRVGTYRYRVKAVDDAGNSSAFSATFAIYASR